MKYEGLTRLFLRPILVLAVCSFFTLQVLGQCTAKSNYCTRGGQRTGKLRKTLPASEVPEAVTGFQHPLNNVRFSAKLGGNNFAESDSVSYPKCGRIFHPGLDINWGGGNADCGSHIGSIADGVVVWIGGNSDWQGLMVQHKYKGEMVLAAYGHVVDIDPRLSVGDTVKKGQYLARVGSVGATSCHLHFEIRRIGSHPDPIDGLFFCRNVKENDVRAWYYHPESFIDSHPAYGLRPNISLLAPDSPVRRKGLRTYEFTVGIQERDGQALNIDWVYLDGVKYTGKQFFGTSKLKARGSLSKKVSVQQWLWTDRTFPYTIKIWNSGGNRWDTWTRLITFRHSW